MNTISNSSFVAAKSLPEAQKILSPLQKKVITKLRDGTNKIAQDVVSVLIASKAIPVNVFIDRHVQTINLSKLDLRTQKFSHKLVAVVNEDLNKIPSLTHSFDLLASYAKDSFIREKLITGIALPTIQALIQDFDSIKPSIVDDINAFKHFERPEPQIILQKLKKSVSISGSNLKKATCMSACFAVAIGCIYWQFYNVVKPPLPYELEAAKKIRVAIMDVFTQGYERPAEFEEDKITKNLKCEKRTYTYETNIHIPYNNQTLQKEASDLLAKIDRLIRGECCFHIVCKIPRNETLNDIIMELKIESPCKIGNG